MGGSCSGGSDVVVRCVSSSETVKVRPGIPPAVDPAVLVVLPEEEDDCARVETWDDYRQYLNKHTQLGRTADWNDELTGAVLAYLYRRDSELRQDRSALLTAIENEFGLGRWSFSARWYTTAMEDDVLQLMQIQRMFRRYITINPLSTLLSSLSSKPLVPGSRRDGQSLMNGRCLHHLFQYPRDMYGSGADRAHTYVFVHYAPLAVLHRNLLSFDRDFQRTVDVANSFTADCRRNEATRRRLLFTLGVHTIRDDSYFSHKHNTLTPFLWAGELFDEWDKQLSSFDSTKLSRLANLVARRNYAIRLSESDSPPRTDTKTAIISKQNTDLPGSPFDSGASGVFTRYESRVISIYGTVPGSSKSRIDTSGSFPIDTSGSFPIDTFGSKIDTFGSKIDTRTAARRSLLPTILGSDPVVFDGVEWLVVVRRTTFGDVVDYMLQNHDRLTAEVCRVSALYRTLEKTHLPALKCALGQHFGLAPEQTRWDMRTPRVQEVIDGVLALTAAAPLLVAKLRPDPGIRLLIVPALQHHSPCGYRLLGDIMEIPANFRVDWLVRRMCDLIPHLAIATPEATPLFQPRRTPAPSNHTLNTTCA